MGKRIWLVIAILVLVISAGCQPVATAVPKPTQASLTDSQIATLSALSTQIHTTPEEAENPTATFTITPGVLPTNTPMPGSIVITGINQQSPDSALITWEVTGDFPSGFRVVWTDVQGSPTFPANNSISVGSPTARSAIINVASGPIYYVRVCRFIYDTCDIYSQLGIFAFAPATATPDLNPARTATAAAAINPATAAVVNTAAATTSGGTDSTLVINSIKDAGSGNAFISWTDKGSSSLGYKIVFSTTSSTPVYTSGAYFVITSSSARSAYINGTGSTKYYYRVCRATSSGCGVYSATYTYTYPVAPTTTLTPTATTDASTIAISSITDVATGSAQVNWTASGSFPSGFKILYSKTVAVPTLSDNVVVVSDGSLRAGIISGDPSGLYYVRVCKYSGSTCTIYSAVSTFTFAADSATISISGLKDTAGTPGNIDLTWTATGTFTSGFKLLYSTTQPSPTFENSSSVAIASGATRTGTIPGSPATHYYLRVCKYTGTTCGVVSTVVEYTTAQTGIVLANDTVNFPGDLTKFIWTLTPNVDNTDGYRLFWIDGKIAPVWTTPGVNPVVYLSTDRQGSLPALTTSGHSYMVRLCYWISASTTCGDYSNAIEVDIP